MNMWETVRLAFSSLKSNKLRSSLTMLGITIGIFTVIGVMTAVSGVKSTIQDGLNFLGANSFQVSKFPIVNFSDPRERFGNRPNILLRDGVRFKDLMSSYARVSMITSRGGRRVFFEQENTNPNINLIGTEENYLTSYSFEVAAGRPISADDFDFALSLIHI